MDKMDDFIKKRVENYSPSEDAWNIPSDDIWNHAKVHFPKQKKRKRLLWLPLSLGLFLCIGIGLYLIKNTLVQKNDITKISNSKNKETVVIDNKKVTSSTPDNQLFSKTNLSLELKKEADHLSTKHQTSLINNETNQKKTASKNTQNKVVPLSNLLVQSDKKEENIDAYKNTFNQKEIKIDSITPTRKLWNTETITTLWSPIYFEKAAPFTSVVLPRKTVSKTKITHFPKQEIGVGYSETLFRLLDIYGVEDTETGNTANIDMIYRNVNFHYTKWVKRKWSFSTGLHYSAFDLDINSSIFSQVTSEEIETYISRQVDNTILFRQVANTSSTPEDAFKITLLDNEQLVAGDSVNVITKLSVYSQLYQIPALVNYHIYRNRFEWIFSAGASIYLENFDQKAVDIEVYKQDRLINEPAQIPATRGINIGGSIHGIVSMRYHVNQQFNLGLRSNIYFSNYLLSNLEVGLYYRF